MELVRPQRGTSWTDIITGMVVGEKIPALLEDRNTVAPLISRQLKYSHPGMKWRTEKAENGTLYIIRTK